MTTGTQEQTFPSYGTAVARLRRIKVAHPHLIEDVLTHVEGCPRAKRMIAECGPEPVWMLRQEYDGAREYRSVHLIVRAASPTVAAREVALVQYEEHRDTHGGPIVGKIADGTHDQAVTA